MNRTLQLDYFQGWSFLFSDVQYRCKCVIRVSYGHSSGHHCLPFDDRLVDIYHAFLAEDLSVRFFACNIVLVLYIEADVLLERACVISLMSLLTSLEKIFTLHDVRLLKNVLDVSLFIKLNHGIVICFVKILSIFRQTLAALAVNTSHKLMVIMIDRFP